MALAQTGRLSARLTAGERFALAVAQRIEAFVAARMERRTDPARRALAQQEAIRQLRARVDEAAARTLPPQLR